jgi:hypothetical protein
MSRPSRKPSRDEVTKNLLKAASRSEQPSLPQLVETFEAILHEFGGVTKFAEEVHLIFNQSTASYKATIIKEVLRGMQYIQDKGLLLDSDRDPAMLSDHDLEAAVGELVQQKVEQELKDGGWVRQEQPETAGSNGDTHTTHP